MSNQIRRAFFLLLLLSFFVIAVPIVLYSYGYRLDISRRSVSESGGIFIRSVPGDAVFKLDGKDIKNESGILNSGTFVKGLLPGKYELSVVKDGYRPLRVIAEVIPFQAVSFDRLLLVPKVNYPVLDGTFSDVLVENGLMAVTDDLGRIKFESNSITGREAVAFTADHKGILTESVKAGTYFFVNLAKTKSALNLTETFWTLKSTKLKLPGNIPMTGIIPHPYEPNRFIITTKSAMYLMDVKQMTISIIGSGADEVQRSGSAIAVIKDGETGLFNLTIRNVSPLISVPGAKKVLFAEGGGHVAVLWKNNILEIYDIRKEKSLRFDISDILPTGKMVWHGDENHMFIDGPAGIYFLETDHEAFKPELIVPDSHKFDYADENLYFIVQGGIRQLKI